MVFLRPFQLAFVALVADPVRGPFEERDRDPLLALADRLEAKPLVSDLEPPAPGTAADADFPGMGVAEDLGKARDQPRVAVQCRGPRLGFDCPPHQILVKRHVALAADDT